MNLKDDLLAVKRVFVNYPKRLEQLKDELKKISEERQDLLHILELGKLDAVRMIQITKELKNVQLRRRKVKDEIEVLEELTFLRDRYKIKENEIDRAVNRVQHIEEKQENRVYAMRVRKDLQELVN